MMSTKNKYEGLFIIRAALNEEGVKAVIGTITDSLARHEGEVKKEEEWGKRALSYPLKKQKEGFYYKVNFEAPSASIDKLRGVYRLNSDILRVMITRR